MQEIDVISWYCVVRIVRIVVCHQVVRRNRNGATYFGYKSNRICGIPRHTHIECIVPDGVVEAIEIKRDGYSTILCCKVITLNYNILDPLIASLTLRCDGDHVIVIATQ